MDRHAPLNDTIFARASGAGKAGVAVFRVSGPEVSAVAEKLCGGLPGARRAAVRTLRDADGSPIDSGLVILFRGPASFTGEDVAEFHVHGSRAVEAALIEALAAAGARPAEAGEFTRRALENGKLDLAQVEALSDLIDAETSEQRRQAWGQLDGRLSALAEGWRRRLIEVLAPLEADIDFPDEEGVPAAVAARAGPAIDALAGELRSYRSASVRLRTIRTGINIAIVGAPNAGKSSLLNRLAGSDVAIVSETPGTTRDVIEVRLDLAGLPVVLADTAGLREAPGDAIESEGMKRALKRAEDAAIRVVVADSVSRETPPLLQAGDFLVWNKIDLAAPPAGAPEGVFVHALSARTGEGVDGFIAALTEAARERFGPSGEAGLTRLRHVQAVEKAIAALERARARVETDAELAAEDARLAARALGEITGAVDVEDVLGEIFSSFCIGK
ncbi:MAG: tRNA uridine-5-carboxymethylaminomethyl(34) synthesis GTPase MnmE [Pseudomonadota bacterium]|nr:tRNA uridine-5-carboxymethylaminomethyl(34) synthesis GTPase MnmE [Pseudomonadota bacterium]